MKKIGLLAILLGSLLGSVAFAQTPEGYYREHMALPAEIRQMLDDNKAKEAVAAYEKFKKTAQADALDMLFLDAEVYGSASFIEPGANYGEMREEAVKKMLELAPKNAEVLMYTMPDDGNPEKVLEVLNKIIEVDPDYLPAYEQRCYIYMEKNMEKEACADYMKLPESIRERVGLMIDCDALTK